MPLIGTLLVSLFGQMAGFMALYVGRKIAVAAAAVACLALLYTAVLVCFHEIVTPLLAALFTTAYGAALGLAFPPIAGTCLSAWTLSEACLAAFRLNTESLKLAARG